MPKLSPVCLIMIVSSGFSAWLINLGCIVMLKRQGISLLYMLMPPSSDIHLKQWPLNMRCFNIIRLFGMLYRTFLGMEISIGKTQLLEVIKIVDLTMNEFKLNTFYKVSTENCICKQGSNMCKSFKLSKNKD